MLVWSGVYVNLLGPYGSGKICKLGFSWTTLIFWWFVPLFRGDWLNALIFAVAAYLTKGLSILVFPFFYNFIYVRALLKKGWQPATYEDEELLKSRGFGGYINKETVGQGGFQRHSPAGGFDSWTEEQEYDKTENWESEKQEAVDVEWHENK